MERAILVSRCSTNESRQDVSRQSAELAAKYSGQYIIVKEFSYYESGTKNDEVNKEILNFSINNNIDHIITLEISRISRKISSFALFLESCNSHNVNIIIDNFQLHTLLPCGQPNSMVQTMLSIASTFSAMELSLIKERLQSGRRKFVAGGGVLGRKMGSVKTTTDLLKDHSDVLKYIRQGQSVRNIMKLTGKSSGTIQKVKKLFQCTD
ncbi:recombinase family protein [Flavobacterium sandaracinum]|uniref:Recombinase family protein n=1 Tax=Flavobacterium sandaracinum TaxID=2541733 RepID=A0A4R5CQ02_9FLAO|nr:recombinase family protein [Flavobacterium sandaracinum]